MFFLSYTYTTNTCFSCYQVRRESNVCKGHMKLNVIMSCSCWFVLEDYVAMLHGLAAPLLGCKRLSLCFLGCLGCFLVLMYCGCIDHRNIIKGK